MKYLLIFVAILLASCQDDTLPTKDTGHNWAGVDVRIIEFDSCEYVNFGGSGNYAWGAHKGNCKNPIHKQ